MRYALAAVALLSIAAPARAAPATDGAFRTLLGTLVRGHCIWDGCEWFSIASATVAGRNRGAVLLRVETRDWMSHHPDGDYDRRRPRKFDGNYSGYILCSKRNPSTIDRSDDGTWKQSALAPGSPGQTGGASELATAVYWAACHGAKVDDIDAAASEAVRLGYAAHIPDPGEPLTLAKPTDALGGPVNRTLARRSRTGR